MTTTFQNNKRNSHLDIDVDYILTEEDFLQSHSAIKDKSKAENNNKASMAKTSTTVKG